MQEKNMSREDAEAYCGEVQKRAESMLISTVLSEKHIIDGTTVTLPIVKVGTAAFDAKGKKFILTKEALESGAESWTGGIVTINHTVKEKGKITKSWFEDPYVYATFEGLPQEAVDAINSAAYRGVSQESLPLEVKDGQVLKLKGTGSTFVFYPHKPACKIEDGCGLPIASTLAMMEGDEERHDFDIAARNNTGKLVKIREFSVFLWGDERGDEDLLKTKIINETAYMGVGEFYAFDRDDNLSLGDEITADRTPAHTVTITISMARSFNFPLYTSQEKLEVNTPDGGANITEDKTKLESTISEQKTEIGTLKSTNERLQKELDEVNGKIPGLIESSVKAALESHDLQLKEQAEMDAAITELKSCMGPETMKTFLEAKPSPAIIKSTITAIKAESSKKIGAAGGTQSTADDEKTYSIASWDAEKKSYV